MIDYTLSNTLAFNNLKNYFVVLDNDFTIENNYLTFKFIKFNI